MMRFFHALGTGVCTRRRLDRESAARASIAHGQRARQSRRLTVFDQRRERGGFTLVEMLVAMSITLIMMAAVVTLFANVSNSVRNRRAITELAAQIRQVRNTLQQDLQGATCPGLTWQRPESNHGYIEYIEGQYREGNASLLVDKVDNYTQAANFNPEIDHAISTLPTSNLPLVNLQNQLQTRWVTDGGGLGDYDDILMLTVRNEQKPFIGRMPVGVRNSRSGLPFDRWGVENFESTLAEVVWFSIENPRYVETMAPTGPTANNFFGEPGYRTVYRRTLLIAPYLNPYRFTDNNGRPVDTFSHDGDTFKAEPGLMRVLPKNITLEQAIAAIVAFQDRYDLSVRLEWDYNHSPGRWKIMANTLGDLTKRENRFCHFGFKKETTAPNTRVFPYAMASAGSGYPSNTQQDLEFVIDPEVSPPSATPKGKANVDKLGSVASYGIDPINYDPNDPSRRYLVRPFVYVDKNPTGVPATAQAVLNENGAVVQVLRGPVPLWGDRRGEDVQLTNVLAFDVRAFDPGAPIFRHLPTGTTLTPTDPGWMIAYRHNDNMGSSGNGSIGKNNSLARVEYPYVGQGAYVDLGYRHVKDPVNPLDEIVLPMPVFLSPDFASSAQPWFFQRRALNDVFGNELSPGYSVYDTWSFHYENDGVNEDGDLTLDAATNQWVPLIDEGTNGLDDRIPNGGGNPLRSGDDANDLAALGIDDTGERETAPPYDKPLRGLQVLLRAYERDSRAIRQVRVNQHFMPE